MIVTAIAKVATVTGLTYGASKVAMPVLGLVGSGIKKVATSVSTTSNVISRKAQYRDAKSQTDYVIDCMDLKIKQRESLIRYGTSTQKLKDEYAGFSDQLKDAIEEWEIKFPLIK